MPGSVLSMCFKASIIMTTMYWYMYIFTACCIILHTCCIIVVQPRWYVRNLLFSERKYYTPVFTTRPSTDQVFRTSSAKEREKTSAPIDNKILQVNSKQVSPGDSLNEKKIQIKSQRRGDIPFLLQMPIPNKLL